MVLGGTVVAIYLFLDPFLLPGSPAGKVAELIARGVRTITPTVIILSALTHLSWAQNLMRDPFFVIFMIFFVPCALALVGYVKLLYWIVTVYNPRRAAERAKQSEH
jgi:hypothetical protein